MSRRLAPVLAALLLLARQARALDKQGSAHGGRIEGPAAGFSVTGSAGLGVALFNPGYPARPDNTGRALLRGVAHLDVDLIGRRLSIPIDLNFFTDRRATPGGRVLVLDAASLETKSTIRVGRVPAEVTFSGDGKYAFVANGASNDVTVIDAKAKTVAKTIAVDREPVGAWPGADGLMYVDCEIAKTVQAIDPKTLDIVRTYSLGFTPGIATVPPSRTEELWLTNTDAGKIVFNKTSVDTKVAELDTGPGAHALAFAPDGKTAFVTNQLGGSVSVVDAATRVVKATVAVGRKPNGIVYRSK